ncbi:sodium/calcium exchanger ncl [Quercus suber]|uniref:Sodium/calcium exchanger ncl n=1 Tax=Quercus suber TaxID=58331 RepID=A0AAW0KYG5_QUESU
MKDFDTSGNSCIEKEEFVDGISRWLNKTKKTAVRNPGSLTKFFDDFHMETKREHDLLDIYATVTIHNVLSIPVFLALVYIRGLTWDFSSEVLVILIVSIGMLPHPFPSVDIYTSYPTLPILPGPEYQNHNQIEDADILKANKLYRKQNCQFRTQYRQRQDQRLAVSTKPTPTTTATTPPNNARQVVMRSREVPIKYLDFRTLKPIGFGVYAHWKSKFEH